LKAERNKRVLIAWLLLLCMIPFTVTKLTHHHDKEKPACCASATDDEDHNSDNGHNSRCTICKFTLSPFVSNDSEELSIFQVLIPSEPVYYVSGHTLPSVHTYLLRGPPAV